MLATRHEKDGSSDVLAAKRDGCVCGSDIGTGDGHQSTATKAASATLVVVATKRQSIPRCT
jgi:hypothetical protein